MTAEALRYCTYCRSKQPAAGFKIMRDSKTGRKVNEKCGKCRTYKRLPVVARDKRGAEVRDARRAYQERKLADNTRKRNEEREPGE